MCVIICTPVVRHLLITDVPLTVVTMPPLCRQCCGGGHSTGQTGAWSQLVQSQPLLWPAIATSHHSYIAVTSSPPQSHTCTTVTSSLLSLGADISALMSYAGTAAVSLHWCITGVTTWCLEPTVQCSSRVTRAESWARLRGGSSVYSAVLCSTPPYR